MKSPILAALLVALPFSAAYASSEILNLHTDSEAIRILHDGKAQAPWLIDPEIPLDSLMTSAREVTLISHIDTVTVSGLADYQLQDIAIITAKGDTAMTRIIKLPEVIYTNPPASKLPAEGSTKLSREQALFDLDALFYALTEIHPDIYSVAGQEKILTALNDIRSAITDSLTTTELYRIMAPLVSMIGDGHTMLRFPLNDFFTADLQRMPLYANVHPDRTITATVSYNSAIPAGARILSINGVSDSDMIDRMLPFVSGEREHFKLSRINDMFTALFELFYGGKTQYEIVYQASGSPSPQSAILPASDWATINAHIPAENNSNTMDDPRASFSYRIDEKNGVAIMDFNDCTGRKKMSHLCDSMFADMRERGINRLIIDVRENGGGDSGVGDILLKYISPKPFTQFDKILAKVSPTTARMIGNTDGRPTVSLYSCPKDSYQQPRTSDNGHFDGTVMLLTSSDTFSSGASFAWTFKQTGCGTVIGEETGGMNVCYGDVVSWIAPMSKLRCTISWKRFWQMEADEFDIHGTLPDVAVSSDKALDEALNLITK